MAGFFTQLNLDERQVRQLTGDTLTLSGLTNFAGTLQSKGTEIDATSTGSSLGDVVTFDGTKLVISASTGTITASNGLTKSNLDIRLGGTLTGDTCVNTGGFGIGFGSGIYNTGANSFGQGVCAHAYGNGSHSEGYCTYSEGVYSHSEGYYTKACGNYSHSEGSNGRAYGIGSHNEGEQTFACGNYSHSEGRTTHACGVNSHAEGRQSCAIGIGSHSEGCLTVSSGASSHSAGCRTKSIGIASHSGGVGISTKEIKACANGSFNHSTNDTNQITGHSANAPYSAILGGLNHNIESGNTGATIIGGDSIKLTGTSYIDTTAVDNLAVMTQPTNNTGGTKILVRNDDTGVVEYIERNTIVNNGENIQKDIIQVAHGFSVGQVVANSGGTYILGIADGAQSAEVFGVVTESATTNQFRVTFAGYVSGLTSAGLTAGNLYYLSPTVAGALTVVEPITGTTVSKPILYTDTTDESLILQHRAIVVASGGTPLNITGATGGVNLGVGDTVFQSLSASTLLFRTIRGSGTTYTFVENDTIYIADSGVTGLANSGAGTGIVYSGLSGTTAMIRTLEAGDGITLTSTGDTILIISTGNTNAIGVARDGDYTDGVFPFTVDTPTGFAIDDINEFLTLLLPSTPSGLTFINSSTEFFDGKLSFGAANGIAGYTNVNTAAGNDAVDINAVYESTGGTRLGIVKTPISGLLNDNVTGDTSGVPFLSDSFIKGDEGEINLELNGTVVNVLNILATTASTSSVSGGTTISVGEVKYAKFGNGNEYSGAGYRIGSYIINTSAMVNGFNYLRILHDSITPPVNTNFVEWVYDPENTDITLSGASFTDLTLSGSSFISGVEYHTGGSVNYNVTGHSVYQNVFSSSAIAIDFPTVNNLTSSATTINISGDSIAIDGVTQALPDLDTGVLDPEGTPIHIQATLTINSDTLLGVSGTSGTSGGSISSNIYVDHPFPDETITGTTLSDAGFLLYNIVQSGNNFTENFTGEARRVQSIDYSTGTSYSALTPTFTGGTFAWDSTQNLSTGNDEHNNGLLIFNGELMHPIATYLDTIYGIVGSNFDNLANAPASNADYGSATGVREYYRIFKSANVSTLATIDIEIDHTATGVTDFITSGATGGTPTGDTVKVEFIIIRTGDTIHGWANPFATSGNPEGIVNTSATHSGGTTFVSASLSTTPRIALDDYVIIKIRAASAWTNRITKLSITNIE